MSDSVNILDFPNELLVHIICFCDVVWINRLSRACKLLKNCCDSKAVWKFKWKELAENSGLNFCVPVPKNDSSDDNPYKDMYKRLWCVWYSKCSSEGLLLNLVPCLECKQLTCAETCSQLCHIAIDIGSSTTRIATEMHDGFLSYSHHPTTVGMARKVNSDVLSGGVGSHASSNMSRGDNGLGTRARVRRNSSGNVVEGHTSVPRYLNCSAYTVSNAQNMPGYESVYSTSLPCENLRCRLNNLELNQRFHSFHNGNNVMLDEAYPSLMGNELLEELTSNGASDNWYLVCLACILKKDHRVYSSQPFSKSYTSVNNVCNCVCHHRDRRDHSHRRYWYCYETAFKDLHEHECIALNPLEAVFASDSLSSMEFHIGHLLKIYHPHVDLHRPNVTVVFCEPWNVTPDLRSKVAKLLFERIKVPRMIFVNKAIATASLRDVQTCIIIDSGCFNTVTTVIINRQIDKNRVLHSPIGGSTVTEYLLDAIRLHHPEEYFDIHSLDHSAVKRQCHVPYLLSIDEKRRRRYECKVKVKLCCSQKYMYVDIGAAHYLAPEFMYKSLDIPGIVMRLLTGLSQPLVSVLLKNVIMTGGNSKLEGFSQRLTKDLRDTFPHFRDFVDVQGSHRAERADAIHGALLYSQSYPTPSYGVVTREDYILYGSKLFQDDNTEQQLHPAYDAACAYRQW